MFTVESGVAMPERDFPIGAARKRKFPIMSMEVGDSFFAGGYTLTKGGRIPAHFKFLRASSFAKHRPGTKWSVRTVTEAGVLGVRVWRVK